MNKQVIIHCGPPKTGSSALQHWFISNRDYLRSIGIMYPEHNADRNGIGSGHHSLLLNHKASGSEFNVDAYKTLLDEFYQSSSKYLLLSSEYFFYHIESFIELTGNVKFVVFIRPECETIESLYNQAVKRNGLAAEISRRKGLRREVISRLFEVINEDNKGSFLLNGYGAQSYFPVSIVESFFSLIGIKVTNIDEQKKSVNRSYSFECLEFKRWSNRFVGTSFDNWLDPLLQKAPFGLYEYSLLPSALFDDYRLQSQQSIAELHAKCAITDYEYLNSYIANLQRKQYMHQHLNGEHFERVVKYLYRRNPTKLKELFDEVREQLLTDSDRELLARYDVIVERNERRNNADNILLHRIKRKLSRIKRLFWR